MMARPFNTMLGGACCRPSALRNRLKTTTSLVKAVTITARYGARARPTTSVRISAGDRLPSSMANSSCRRLRHEHARDAHTHQVANANQFADCNRSVVGLHGDGLGVQALVQFEHVARRHVAYRAEGQREPAGVESKSDGQGVRVNAAVARRRLGDGS